MDGRVEDWRRKDGAIVQDMSGSDKVMERTLKRCSRHNKWACIAFQNSLYIVVALRYVTSSDTTYHVVGQFLVT